MRKHDPVRPVGQIRLVIGHPAQLRDGERGERHTADGVGPCLRSAEFGDQVFGRGRGADIVPQQRIPYRQPIGIQRDETVLLTGDGNGVDVIDEAVSGRAQCLPPGFGSHFRARRVRCVRLRKYLAGVCVADNDLA